MIRKSLSGIIKIAEVLLENINFPQSYKKALERGSKNVTLRVGPEAGKYLKGETYNAQSYAGNPMDLRVKINDSISVPLRELLQHGIPQRSVDSLQRKENLTEKDIVNLIRFSILKEQQT